MISITKAYAKNLLYKHHNTIFAATFVKKDGTTRRMVGRHDVKVGVNGKGMAYDPFSKDLITCWDFQKKAWRMININTLQSLRLNRITYTVR